MPLGTTLASREKGVQEKRPGEVKRTEDQEDDPHFGRENRWLAICIFTHANPSTAKNQD